MTHPLAEYIAEKWPPRDKYNNNPKDAHTDKVRFSNFFTQHFSYLLQQYCKEHELFMLVEAARKIDGGQMKQHKRKMCSYSYLDYVLCDEGEMKRYMEGGVFPQELEWHACVEVQWDKGKWDGFTNDDHEVGSLNRFRIKNKSQLKAIVVAVPKNQLDSSVKGLKEKFQQCDDFRNFHNNYLIIPFAVTQKNKVKILNYITANDFTPTDTVSANFG